MNMDIFGLSPILIIILGLSVSCASSLEVRLVGGWDMYHGRVEVRHEGVWGTICDDDWDILDANVVCRMLGFGNATAAYGYAAFGEGSGIIFLDNVQCNGMESDIGDCSHNGFENHNCHHAEDACVRCSPTVSLEDIPVRLVGGQTEFEGRVEVFFNGSWGTVCDDYWDVSDARVVCKMLGFKGALGAPGSATYAEGSGPIVLENVYCFGNERKLAECSHSGFGVHNCYERQGAAVVCSNESIDHVSVRLADGRYKNEGRVEIFFNGSWGTVCAYGSHGWYLREADVVCRMAGFSEASDVLYNAAFGQGVGRALHFQGISCLGSETNLMDCSFEDFVANSCPHIRDVGVMCKDTDNVSTGSTAKRTFSHVSIAMIAVGTILAVAYVVFLLRLYVCHRRSDQERKKQTDKSKKTTDPSNKDDQSELEYMSLQVPASTFSADSEYTALSFTKSSDTSDESGKPDAPILMKSPVGHKSSDRMHPSSALASNDPIYVNC